MDRKKKTFDAVAMVREIRDRHHGQFKDKSTEERIAYYRKKAQDFHQRLKAKREDNAAA